MTITKEFLEGSLRNLETERRRHAEAALRCEGAMLAVRQALQHLEKPEPATEEPKPE